MPIYTKTGDQGNTSLFSGKRVLKSDLRVEAYGSIDELNSLIGFALSNISEVKKDNKYLKKSLISVQEDLFYIAAFLADLSDAIENINLEEKTLKHEKLIDEMTKKMPPLSNFIYPGGGKAGAILHIARTSARRAERNIVRLSQKDKVDGRVFKYINRLSDLLFTMARFSNFIEGKKERIWER